MRNFRLSGSLVVAALLTILSCDLDPAAEQPMVGAPGGEPEQPMAEAPGEEPERTTLEDSPEVLSPADDEEASAIEPGGDVASIAPNCSVVEYCNAPGADGTRCLQRGCSLGTAENECKREARIVCGSTRCPLIFVKSGGIRVRLGCPPNVCGGGAIECGQRCCGSSATFCAGTRCCDGIHCGGGCPC